MAYTNTDNTISPILISACETFNRMVPDKEFQLVEISYQMIKIGPVYYPKIIKRRPVER